MYLVKSIRTFIGTNTERVSAGLSAFLAGDQFVETDTSDTYIHDGMAWLLNSDLGGASDIDDLTTDTGASGEMVRVAAAGGLEYRTTAEVLGDIGAAASGHSHAVPGSDTQVIFNDGGALAGDAGFVFNKTTNFATLSGGLVAGTSTISTDGDSFGAQIIQIGDMSADSNAFVGRLSGRLLIKRAGSGTLGTNVNYQPDTTDGNQLAVLGAATDTTGAGATALQAVGQIRAVFTTHDHATRAMRWDFYTSQGGAAVSRMYIGAGVVVGAPTGGDKGAGTLNAVAVYDDNTLLTDYVFEPDYSLLTIDAMTAFYETNKHLPTIPGRDEWEKDGKFSLGKLANHLWETVEVQAIYISQLHKRLERLEYGN